jgi:hypothetical protein
MRALNIENIVRYVGIVGGIEYFGRGNMIRSLVAGTVGGTLAVVVYDKISSGGGMRFKDELAQNYTPSAFGALGYTVGGNMNFQYSEYVGMIVGTYLSTA